MSIKSGEKTPQWVLQTLTAKRLRNSVKNWKYGFTITYYRKTFSTMYSEHTNYKTNPIKQYTICAIKKQ